MHDNSSIMQADFPLFLAARSVDVAMYIVIPFVGVKTVYSESLQRERVLRNALTMCNFFQ